MSTSELSPIQVDSPHHASSSLTPPILPSRLQPVSPLAPLEYLQNQRRGSITDPSLHAHTHTPPLGRDPSTIPSQLPIASKDDPPRTKNAPVVTRPTSPYVFGNATADLSNSSTRNGNPTHSHPPTDKNLRRLLHSPTEANHHSPYRSFSDPQKPPDTYTRAMSGPPEQRPHELDPHSVQSRRHSDEEKADEIPEGFPPGFDWAMRRHSIAVGSPHALPFRSPNTDRHSLKRKISSDRDNYPTLTEEGDPLGHGFPLDVDTPALKSRRGSAFDTRRLGALSLYDRRDSMDTRPPGPPQPYWDRRDSVASTFSNLSSTGGYASSGFSGDSISRNLQTFAWHPPNSNSNHTLPLPPGNEGIQHEVDTHMAGTSHPYNGFEAVNTHPAGMPGLPDHSDRRATVPDATLPTGPDRPRRIRPRPNSRGGLASDSIQTGISTQTNSMHGNKAASATTPGDSSPQSANSGSGSTLAPPPLRDGISPYSRSPELRVSHKLAERKRRKEMKELFDELRDQLPADRSMKASKWEILSKAIDYITCLNTALNDSQRQVEVLRMELDKTRGNAHYPSVSNPPIVHSQAPTVVTSYGHAGLGDTGSGPTSASSVTSRSTPAHSYPILNGSRRSPTL